MITEQFELREEESREEKEIDTDEIVKESIENLRKDLQQEKEKGADSHWKGINVPELTMEDLMIYDKWKKGTLVPQEFNSYSERLRQYFKEQKQQKAEETINNLRKKLKEKEITSEEFDQQVREMLKKEDVKRSLKGLGYISDSFKDSRANLQAMIRNQMINQGLL
ncbi:MAG: hypothetical protein V1892_03605 [bacterium]